MSVALYKPLGIAGLVLGTVAASAVMLVLQLRSLHWDAKVGRQVGRMANSIFPILVAAGLLGAVSWVVSLWLEGALGESFAAGVVTVGTAACAGLTVYVGVVMTMRIPEAHDIVRLVVGRVRGR